jgi:hypothetical protein
MATQLVERRTMRRPRVGQMVLTRFGWAKITEVRHGGLVLVVETEIHGTEWVERACNGWWTILVES